MTALVVLIAFAALAILCAPQLHTTVVQPGLGTTLSWSATSGGTYATISQRVSIDGPEPEQGETDTTHLDSTIKGYRPTLPDIGLLTLSIWWDPQDTNHIQLETWATGVSQNVFWKLLFADTGVTTAAFSGYVKSFKKTGADPEGNLTGTVEIRLTSAPAYTHTGT